MKHFYQDLPEAPSFDAVFTGEYFKPLPPSWFIATTDVVNSTGAIAEGRYRDVTIAGTLGTIALANHLGSLEFPFFFGGDGMVFLIPPGEDGAARDLLYQTREMVWKMARLDLRTHLADTPGAHPVAVARQFTTAGGNGARLEGRVKSRQRRGWRYVLFRSGMFLEVMIVRIALITGLPIRAIGKNFRAAREDNQMNADIQKLDGTLKAILSLPSRETTALITELERLHRTGLIRYGYHQSDRAIMTCMVHVNRTDEVHFIDAADGGYARAALMLKSQRAAAHEPERF